MTCGSAAHFKKRRLNQSTCTNSDIPLWLNTRKPPARKDGPQHHPTKDKTNRILYIMCGVLAIMLVGIFTKLGLEKAHRGQRKPSPGRLPPLHPTPSPPLWAPLSLLFPLHFSLGNGAPPPNPHLRWRRSPGQPISAPRAEKGRWAPHRCGLERVCVCRGWSLHHPSPSRFPFPPRIQADLRHTQPGSPRPRSLGFWRGVYPSDSRCQLLGKQGRRPEKEGRHV